MLSKCSREYAQHLNLNGEFIENLQKFKALLNLKKYIYNIIHIFVKKTHSRVNLIMFIPNYIIFLRKVFFITFTSFII